MTCLLCNGVPDPNICEDLCSCCLRDGERLNDLSSDEYQALKRRSERNEMKRLGRIQRELRRLSLTYTIYPVLGAQGQ